MQSRSSSRGPRLQLSNINPSSKNNNLNHRATSSGSNLISSRTSNSYRSLHLNSSTSQTRKRSILKPPPSSNKTGIRTMTSTELKATMMNGVSLLLQCKVTMATSSSSSSNSSSLTMQSMATMGTSSSNRTSWTMETKCLASNRTIMTSIMMCPTMSGSLCTMCDLGSSR